MKSPSNQVEEDSHRKVSYPKGLKGLGSCGTRVPQGPKPPCISLLKQGVLRRKIDKKIEAARGRAESRKLEALATAEATRVEAEARARAIELESAVLRGNPDILKLRLIERWNGVMPQVMSGESGNLLFSLGNLTPSTVAPTTTAVHPENR